MSIGSRGFFAQVRERTGFAGDLAEFESIFGDIFVEIVPMTALLPQLGSAGIARYVFSNTNEMAVRHIRAAYPFYAGFDGYVLSYEEKAMKPDASIYEVVERRSGLKGQDLFYLDDRPENVEAACQRGWQAVLHETPKTSIQALRSAGLSVS